jgi:multidrug efflux pump subunit AcrB
MWIVWLALRRPYTFVVMAILIAILGVTAIVTMPVDIFPYIDIPIVSVLWQYRRPFTGGDGKARRHAV